MLSHSIQGCKWAAVIVLSGLLGLHGIMSEPVIYECGIVTKSIPNIAKTYLSDYDAGFLMDVFLLEPNATVLLAPQSVQHMHRWNDNSLVFEVQMPNIMDQDYMVVGGELYCYDCVVIVGPADPHTKEPSGRGYCKVLRPLDFRFVILCFFANVFYERWKQKSVLALILKSSNWVANCKASGQRGRLLRTFAYHKFVFWVFCFSLFTPALGVTCRSCFDGIQGCTGGADCLFATRTAANLAALTVGGVAINVASLLPASYVRHLPSQVLRTLAAIARVGNTDDPPDLGPMTLTELQECLSSGRIETAAYKAELSSRLADQATAAAQVTRISAMLLGLQSGTTSANTRHIEGINSYGVLGYLVAAASLIVNSGKRTYSAGTASSEGSSSSGGSGTLNIRIPTSGSQFSELLMVWQTLAHAVGAANILATVPFLQQVVWDGISTLGLYWQQAYCLFIIYLEAIEDSRGTLHLANVFAAGAQDTRLKAANQRYTELFSCQLCDDQDGKGKEIEKGKGVKKWNNKDSPNANKVCTTYNFKDAEHPQQHLHKDGTCKFRHVCNHWVTGKGPGGMCEGDHPKWACTNPNKTNTKPTQ